MRRRAGIDCRSDTPGETSGSQGRSAPRPHTEAHLAGGDARQPLVLLRLRRAVDERERRHDDAAGERDEGRGAAQGLRRDCGIQHAEAGAAEAFGYQQAGQAELGQAVP